jgi:hypothetical protein
MRWSLVAGVVAVVVGAVLGAQMPAEAREDSLPEQLLDVHKWSVIERESGPVSYYAIVEEQGTPFIRATYRPGLETVVLGVKVDDADRKGAHKLRWNWRALVLPRDGNACVSGKGDSAASVYVSWKRGMKWYTLKYVWSADVAPGTVCHRKRSAFAAQDTIVLRSGGPLTTWETEEIDLQAEFRSHFEDGDPQANVPELAGVGIMTDGDQTKSPSAADYASFVLAR